MKKLTLIIVIFFSAIFVFVALFGIYFSYELNHRGSSESKEFVVQNGQTTREIANNLHGAGLINSSFIFRIYAKFKGALIQAGVYKLSAASNIPEILNVLVSGKANEFFITIPEGWRITQIDEYLANKGIIKAGDLVKIASSDEGYLFPDTYRFMPDTPASEIYQEMFDNFKKKTANLNLTREQLILASIVEREAKFDEDRPKIAGVYLNRLEKNMKLEADPTVQYAKGSWEPITTADYHSVVSPYNTYLYLGLPPGPICNPGMKSIEAVLDSQKDGYLYFFHTSDGRAVFSNTLEEHQENLKKYQ